MSGCVMDPYTYIKSLTEEEVADLAEKCETTPAYLDKLACSHKRGQPRMKPRLAALLEMHTDKKVCRWESIPDEWHVIWPELVGMEGVPPPSTVTDGAVSPVEV